MIDIKTMRTGLINVVRTAVGEDLSLIGPEGSEFPAVIAERQSGNMPQYPYIVVDYLNQMNSDGWLTDKSLDVNDNIVYDTHKLLFFRVTCYGEDGHQIMNKLKSRLRFDTHRQSLKDQVGASFESESEVREMPQSKNIKYIENGFMDLTLSYVDSEADTASTVIETIGTQGEIVDAEGNTLTNINVNVP